MSEAAKSPKTPIGPRRKLVFEKNISPAMAGLRATPKMTPSKRALERDGSTVLGTPSKRQFRGKEEGGPGVREVAGIKNIADEVEVKVE